MLKQYVKVISATSFLLVTMLGHAQQVQIGGVGLGVTVVGAGLSETTAMGTTGQAYNSFTSAAAPTVEQLRVILSVPNGTNGTTAVAPALTASGGKCIASGTSLGSPIANTTTATVSKGTPNPGVVTWTNPAGGAWAIGTPVIFSGAAVPTPLVLGTTYYIATTPAPTSTTFSVTLTSGGSGSGIVTTTTATTGNTADAFATGGGAPILGATAPLGYTYVVVTSIPGTAMPISTAANNTYYINMLNLGASAAMSAAPVLVFADDQTCVIGALYVL